MSTTFEKKHIVSSTDLVRKFSQYIEKDLLDHNLFVFKRNVPEAVIVSYERFEEMENALEEMRELLEHIAIYKTVQDRKDSPEKEVSVEELRKKYGL